MKKLFAIVAALALLIVPNVEGATASGNYTSAGTNSLLSVSGSVYSIVIANTAASASTVAFVDSSDTTLTYTLAAYTNTLTYSTNITNIITTSTGVSQTNISSGIWTERQNNAASTNNRPSIVTLTVPASSTLTYSFGGAGYSLRSGICVTNDTNANITVTYVPDL